MRIAVIILAVFSLTASPVANEDPRAIVRKSLAAMQGPNEKRLLDYLYLERVETKRLDDSGEVKSVTGKTHEIRMLEGSPYRRLIERDGKPVPEEEARLQEAYLKDNIDRRRRETSAERAKRIAEYEKRRDRYRSALKEIPEAFDFRLVGEETIGGRPVWVIDATPRPGYQPKDRYSKLYTETQGRLWIDKRELQWVKLRAELRDVVAFGWILVRLHKGGRVEMEQLRLDDGVWAPKRMWYRVSARIGLIKQYHIEEATTYTSYAKNLPPT